MSEDKKKASSKAKTAEEKKKEEVLENIMEELEEEAKEKEAADTSATKEDKDDAEANPTVEKEDKKKEKKNPLQEKIDELNDKVLRQMAEFENFRKRTDKEKSQQFDLGQSNVLEKLLPIVDNFERGLAAVPENEKEGAFADGMNKIYKQLIKQLEDLGVTPKKGSVYYCPYYRVKKGQPTTKCKQASDEYSGKVGFLTVDEEILAGRSATSGMQDYLYNSAYYWLGSPVGFLEGTAFVFRVSYDYSANGGSNVHSSHGVRPVVSLSPNTSYTGSGTTTDPFIVN